MKRSFFILLTLLSTVLLTACSDGPSDTVIEEHIRKYALYPNLTSWEETNSYSQTADNGETVHVVEYKASFEHMNAYGTEMETTRKKGRLKLTKRGKLWYSRHKSIIR